MTNHYICIHGHFYQPPRENAWLEAIELQDSAYPYHDWNARITSECYEANAASRVLDEESLIIGIVNNYARISFNFGPSLLGWMEANAPEVYQAVIDADAGSRERFSGHGSAMAQVYNHIIMPLANERDKRTQVLWGIRDFITRFGRRPEGMWLPETAADHETLDVMADAGIRFAVLNPGQAARTRAFDEKEWRDVSDGGIDPTAAYLQRLPSGREIALFFYDGPVSQAVGFEDLLNNGEDFARRLMSAFSDSREHAQLVHIATDGETFGHHHRHGDMALAYALDFIENSESVRLTNYGEFLEKHPPVHEVDIFDDRSWSCAHGIERWRDDCGCSSGDHPHWNQAWRKPLRDALDWLRDISATSYEKKMKRYVALPWKARDEYIDIVQDRSIETIEAFFSRNAEKTLTPSEIVTVLKLLEMQRRLMLMYTSCGWFFDEISGIETVQIIQYADRAMQLYNDVFENDLSEPFLDLLEQAKSNIPEHLNGRRIYEKFVYPARVDLKTVAAHYVISAMFQEGADEAAIYCYETSRMDHHWADVARARLETGRIAVTSRITQETGFFYFGVVYFGEHNLTCGVREDLTEESYQELRREIFECFEKADFALAIQIVSRYFESSLYSIKTLFRDEQRMIIQGILESALENTLSVYRNVYENHLALIRFLKSGDTPVPREFSSAAEIVLNHDLSLAFGREDLNGAVIRDLLEQTRMTGVPLHADTLEYTLRSTLYAIAEKLEQAPETNSLLEKLAAGVELVFSLPFDVSLRKIQNLFYNLMQNVYPGFREKALKGDEDAKQWIALFEEMIEKLKIRLDSQETTSARNEG